MIVTLAPIGLSKISDSIRQCPFTQTRHSPAAPELPGRTYGNDAHATRH
jgi:hypothetical protein